MILLLNYIATPRCLEILGDGKQNKSYLYIDDCINALIHVATIERTFEIFNAGSNDRINVLDIANIVINELSLDNVMLRFTGGIDGRGWKGDVKEMLLDSSKLEASGWKAKYNSREAVTLTARGIDKQITKAEGYKIKTINRQKCVLSHSIISLFEYEKHPYRLLYMI